MRYFWFFGLKFRIRFFHLDLQRRQQELERLEAARRERMASMGGMANGRPGMGGPAFGQPQGSFLRFSSNFDLDADDFR